MPRTQPSPTELLKEISFGSYISDAQELARVSEACLAVLASQHKCPSNWAQQVKTALEFTRILWKKYDCEEVAELYSKFQRIEEGLFGLERDETAGKRYRDHFVHMFNCYVFGLRLITAMLTQFADVSPEAVFKVRDEKLRELGLPFGENYSYKKRLFYLWTLIATFHDIAIPFQHLKNIGSGINQFVQEFGWELTDPHVDMRNYDASHLYYYFDLLGRLYQGRLELDADGVRYRQSTRNHYLARILGREFDDNNHGVLSGFFMWKTVEEIFLVSKTSKYQLTVDQFNTYTECVLEQDIARAALAISLHSLQSHGPRFVPRVFPVRFAQFPLTFLLLLADDLQEYLRFEGMTLAGQMRFGSHPSVSVTVAHEGGRVVPHVEVFYSWAEADEANVIAQATAVAKHTGQASDVPDLSRAADIIGNSMKDSLEHKLMIGDDFRLSVEILVDWGRRLYGKELQTKELQTEAA